MANKVTINSVGGSSIAVKGQPNQQVVRSVGVDPGIASGIANTALNTANTANINSILAIQSATAAFDKANSANVLAFNTGIGANTYLLATIAGANTAVGAGANTWANTKLANTTGTFAGTLTIANNLIINSNVGIGTTSPTYKLDLDGTERISTTAGQPLLLYKYGSASPTIAMFAANGTKDSPTQTLTGDIIGGITMFGYGPTGFAGGPSIRIRGIAAENNGTTVNRGTDLTFETVSLGGVSAQERLRITANGDVGIGINAPTAKLTVASGTSPTSQHIYGTYTDVSNYERINLTANSTGHYIIGQQAGTGSARPLYLGANNATAVTIDANGNVGIGTTSPTQRLTVTGSISSTYFSTGSDTSTVTSKLSAGVSGAQYFVTNGTNGWKLPFGYNNGASSTTFGVLTDLKFAATANGQFVWTNVNYNSSQANPTTDTGIARNSPGVVKITDSSTGNGSLILQDLTAYGTANITTSAVVAGMNVVPTVQAALALANAALANATGTFNGTLTVANDLIVTGNATFDTNTLYVDATNNRVGINTTLPTEKLQVEGNAIINGNVAVGGTITLENAFEFNSTKNTAKSNTDTVVSTFTLTKYRGGKFTIVGRSGTESHITELLLTHNFSNTFYTEYGSVYTSISLFTVSSDILGDNVRVILTPSSSVYPFNFDVLEQKLIADLILYDSAMSVILDRANTTIEARAA